MSLILRALTFILVIYSSSGQVYQRITFYSEPYLNGASETLQISQETVSPIVASAKSFCSELGLWQLTILENGGGSTNVEIIQTYGGSYGPIYCVNVIPVPVGKNWAISSVKLIGERDLTVSSLTVFDNANFLGEPTFFLSSEVLDSEVTFKSYFITGNTNWGVFAGNRTGDEKCLATRTDGGANYGARAEAYLNDLKSPTMTIGSVRQGCEGDGDSPGFLPPPSPSGSGTALLNGFLLIVAFMGITTLNSFSF